MLGCTVDASSGAAEQSGHGGGVDDVARFTLFQHARQKGLDAIEHTGDVDAEGPVPEGSGLFPERLVSFTDEVKVAGNSSVVAEDMDGTEVIEGLSGEAFDGLLVADVGLDTDNIELALAELGDGGFEGGDFDVCKDDAHALLGEAFSEGASYSGRCSSDYRYFSFELLYRSPPSMTNDNGCREIARGKYGETSDGGG
jgi:hypothetical protein